MIDDEDVRVISADHVHWQLDQLAARLAHPERAYERHIDWLHALLRVVPGSRADVWQLYDLAAVLTVRELIAAL